MTPPKKNSRASRNLAALKPKLPRPVKWPVQRLACLEETGDLSIWSDCKTSLSYNTRGGEPPPPGFVPVLISPIVPEREPTEDELEALRRELYAGGATDEDVTRRSWDRGARPTGGRRKG